MKHLKNIDIVKEKIGEWNPSSVAFIRDISFEGRVQDISGEYFSLLKMTMLYQPHIKHATLNGTYPGWPNLNEKFWRIVIEFRNINQLSLKGGAMEIQTSGFKIDDYITHQFENINLYISDYENEYISFYAMDGNIKSCEEISFWNVELIIEQTDS